MTSERPLMVVCPDGQLKTIQGEQHITHYMVGNNDRAFCSKCGTRLWSYLGHTPVKYYDVYPSAFELVT